MITDGAIKYVMRWSCPLLRMERLICSILKFSHQLTMSLSVNRIHGSHLNLTGFLTLLEDATPTKILITYPTSSLPMVISIHGEPAVSLTQSQTMPISQFYF